MPKQKNDDSFILFDVFMRLVRVVEYLSDEVFKCKTYVIENTVVLLLLIIIRMISWWLDFSIFWQGDDHAIMLWIANRIIVFAGYFTFQHAWIAERLREVQEIQHKDEKPVNVACYPKLMKVYYVKEVLWILAFILIPSRPALAVSVMFVGYPRWRKLWRRYHPVRL